MKQSILLLGVLGLSQAAVAGTYAGANQTVPWLNLASSARSEAMGGAGVALSGDVNQLTEDPAALANLTDGQASFMHQAFILDTSREHAAFGAPVGPGGLAVEADYMNFGSVSGYSLDQNSQLVQSGNLYPSGLDVDLGYGLNLGPVAVGIGGKYIDENLDGGWNTSTFAVDLGGQWKMQGFSVGAALQNLGNSLDDAPLPTAVRVGAAYDFESSVKGLTLAADGDLPTADISVANYSVGGEYKAMAGNLDWALRAGYKIAASGGDSSGLSFGLGLKMGRYGVDYAYLGQGSAGTVNDFQLSASF